MKPKHTPQPQPQPSQADRDHRSRQLDPQQDPYWQSRGLPGKPESSEPPPEPPRQKQ